jgi:serine/threonine protein kinase/Tol biopolymer transport system component
VALASGTRLGPYEILSAIGAGGMGEVYLARDTKLNRDVALKVLPERFTSVPDRHARFQHEAKVLASLNHPNIAAIYGIEDSNATQALIMELVEGPTLADRIAQGRMLVEEALPIAKQIAEALGAAHEQGIIHRDLKPANVKVREDGTVKVLDFGLAKAMELTAAMSPDASMSPTTPAMTQAGVILGTAAYMAPEQALGKKGVDKRADIWAFGVLLYELLTGKRPFAGDNTSEILASVIRDEPDLSSAPAQLQRLLKRCLEKDPKKRLRDIGDMDLLVGQEEAGPISRGRRLRIWPWIATAAALLIALALLLFVFARFRDTPGPVLLANIATPEGTAQLRDIAISPDGRFLVMAPEAKGQLQLWLRKMDTSELLPMPNTEGAVRPFWSPDSREIAFFANGKLKKVAVGGGPAQSLCDVANPQGGSWSPGGVIVFSPGRRGVSMQRVSSSGGMATDVTTTKGDLENPVFLPDGRRFLYVARGGTADSSGIFVGSLDGTENRRLLADVSPTVFAPSAEGHRTGHILFIRDNALMAAPFDASRAQLAGGASPVAAGVLSAAASANGILVYSSGSGDAEATAANQLGWYDRTGKLLAPVGAPGAVLEPAIAHDEKSVAFRRTTNGKSDLWVRDLNRGTETRITQSSSSYAPFWSPQDDRIVFQSAQNGASELYQRLSNGSGRDEPLLRGEISLWPSQWSRDGRYIVYFEVRSKNNRDIWVLPTERNLRPIPFLTTEADEFMGQLSPDSHWMAFTSDRSGRRDVYVRPFPSGEGEWTISVAGGRAPRWRGDGGELFFIAADGKITAVPVKGIIGGGKPSFEAGTPVALFDANIAHAGLDTAFEYDVTADGNRFLIDTGPRGGPATQLTAVANWEARLRK